eukprot:133671-Lingulodinium_polyedra.AAC.1
MGSLVDSTLSLQWAVPPRAQWTRNGLHADSTLNPPWTAPWCLQWIAQETPLATPQSSLL